MKKGNMKKTLKNMGVDIDKIPKNKLNSLIKFAQNIKDPKNMNQEDLMKITEIMTLDKKPLKKVKIGRNEKCPCGSDKKYKKCCI